jgi:hypothetical protein
VLVEGPAGNDNPDAVFAHSCRLCPLCRRLLRASAICGKDLSHDFSPLDHFQRFLENGRSPKTR